MTRKRRPRRHSVAPYTPSTDPVETNPELAKTLLEIVDAQLRDGDPPETRRTFDRLVAMGHSPEGARQLIAQVVLREIFAVMASGQRYDAARFIAALERLPALPGDKEEGPAE